MNRKPNIGIIGAGMVADFHVAGVQEDGRAEVTWLADTNRQVLEEKLRKHSVPNGSTDHRDILNDDRVDAVIISTPPFTHFDLAMEAIKAGKHVVIEKPMVISRRQLNKLVNAVARHKKLVVLECSCRHARLQPKFGFVKKMIDNGDIGDVYHIHHNSLMRRTFIEYNPKGAWALKKRTAGAGPLLDWGVYDLSFHLGLLNDRPELVGVRSFTRDGIKVFADPKIKSDVEEHGAAFMEFNTGLTYYYERGAGVHCQVGNETRIFGTRGSLKFGYCSWDTPEIEHFWVDKNRRERMTIRKVDMSKHPGDNPAFEAHFIDCLLGKAKPMMPVKLAAKHLDILFRILGK